MQIKDVDGYSFIENILILKNSVPSSDITQQIIRKTVCWTMYFSLIKVSRIIYETCFVRKI